MIVKRRTDELAPGDTVALPFAGARRVVASIESAGYVCRNNEPGLIVRYVPGSGRGQWSDANGSSASGEWSVVVGES